MRPGRSEETAQQVFSVNDPVLPAIGPPAAELEAYYGENVAFGDFFRKLRMEEFVHYSFFELCIPFKGWNFRFVQSQIIDRQGAQGAKKAVHVHFVDNQFQRCPVDFLTVSVNKHRPVDQMPEADFFSSKMSCCMAEQEERIEIDGWEIERSFPQQYFFSGSAASSWSFFSISRFEACA